MINNIDIFYDNIYQINKYSNLVEYPSIKNKISSSECNNILNYKNLEVGNFYISMSQIRGNVSLKNSKKMVEDDFYTLISKDNEIANIPTNHMFFSFNNLTEAQSFQDYLKTKFVRFCLSILKNNSQLDRGELTFIPWMDFSQTWTDEKLYKYFDLSNSEIQFIETSIPSYY